MQGPRSPSPPASGRRIPAAVEKIWFSSLRLYRGLSEKHRNALAPGTPTGSRYTVWIANILAGTIVLFLGIIIRAFNASGLIAGYNTASAEEKAEYDEEALTGFVGALLIAASAILLAGGLLAVAGAPGFVAGASWLLFLVVIIGGVVYLNTGDRFGNG